MTTNTNTNTNMNMITSIAITTIITTMAKAKLRNTASAPMFIFAAVLSTSKNSTASAIFTGHATLSAPRA